MVWIWNKRYGMIADSDKIESAIRALGLHSDEMTVLADFAELRSREWAKSATQVPGHGVFENFWKYRAQRWRTHAAWEQHRQDEYNEQTG